MSYKKGASLSAAKTKAKKPAKPQSLRTGTLHTLVRKLSLQRRAERLATEEVRKCDFCLFLAGLDKNHVWCRKLEARRARRNRGKAVKRRLGRMLGCKLIGYRVSARVHIRARWTGWRSCN